LEGGSVFQGTVFRITTSGELTTLYDFCSQNGCSGFPRISAISRARWVNGIFA
jgi:uncharacterized repeat protein (TIGR03803 family)